MSKNTRKIRDAKALNIRLPCGVSDCSENRAGVGRYCTTHTRRVTDYGHPNGVAVPREAYELELREVSKLFESFKDHPGLVSVLKWLDDWIEEASKGEAPCGNRIFGRIHIKRIHGLDGLSTLDILTELCAIWVFAQRNPQRLPDDLRLTFALSRNTARLATFERKRYGSHSASRHPPGSELKATGEHIRQVLALFFINVEEGLKRQADKAQLFRNNLSIPFVE